MTKEFVFESSNHMAVKNRRRGTGRSICHGVHFLSSVGRSVGRSRSVCHQVWCKPLGTAPTPSSALPHPFGYPWPPKDNELLGRSRPRLRQDRAAVTDDRRPPGECWPLNARAGCCCVSEVATCSRSHVTCLPPTVSIVCLDCLRMMHSLFLLVHSPPILVPIGFSYALGVTDLLADLN